MPERVRIAYTTEMTAARTPTRTAPEQAEPMALPHDLAAILAD